MHSDDCLTPWNELSLYYNVNSLALIQWEVDGKVFVQTVIVVASTEAILSLDFLGSCSVDLVKHR